MTELAKILAFHRRRSPRAIFLPIYRPDGRIEDPHISWTSSGDLKWTYTAAGRELTQSDPNTGSSVAVYRGSATTTTPTTTVVLRAKTYTYDALGQVASSSLPETYDYSQPTYDAEGSLASYQASNGANLFIGATSRSIFYNVRNELL